MNECLSPDIKIFKETAYMWEKSWSNQFGTETSGRIKFSYDSIRKLQGLESDPKGIRMYYCLMNERDTIPSLAMVNIDDTCTDLINCDDGNCILFSELDTIQNEYFINQKTLDDYTQRWRNFVNSKRDIHSPVYAYNYEWASIEDMIDPEVVAPGLWVKYGLRTLSPADTLEFGQRTVQVGDATITGSIVYCNITYGQSPMISIGNRKSTNELFDFAKPCPRYCNDSISMNP